MGGRRSASLSHRRVKFSPLIRAGGRGLGGELGVSLHQKCCQHLLTAKAICQPTAPWLGDSSRVTARERDCNGASFPEHRLHRPRYQHGHQHHKAGFSWEGLIWEGKT